MTQMKTHNDNLGCNSSRPIDTQVQEPALAREQLLTPNIRSVATHSAESKDAMRVNVAGIRNVCELQGLTTIL